MKHRPLCNKFEDSLFFDVLPCFHHQLPPAWPEQGWLEFHGVVLAYRDGLPNALDGVSLVVKPGEKVGIVGRTGSGKSTMFLALFRMVELSQGQILLDGLDISTVGLAQLRYVRNTVLIVCLFLCCHQFTSSWGLNFLCCIL